MEGDIKRALNRVDGRGAGRQVGQQFSQSAAQSADFSGVERKMAEAGRRGSSALSGALKAGLAGAAAGVAAGGIAGIATVLTRGFDRLKTIDSARFKLQALGNDAGTVQSIMDSALKSVQGTAFSMGDAASAAASAVAAGVKPGEQLTKYLSSIGDSAAVAGTNFNDMASIFNKVRANGVAYTDDLQQLQDRGLPVMQLLREQYGVTADEFRKMVEDGKVSAADFEGVLTNKIGGAAQKMGQSFEGSMQNLTAATARVGANFLSAIFGGDSTNQLAGPTEAVQALTDKFDQVNAWITANGPRIREFFSNMAADVRAVATPLGQLAGLLLDHPRLVQTAAEAYLAFKSAQVLGSIATLSSAIGTGRGPGATGLVGGVFTLAATLGMDLGFTIFDKMKQGARDAQAAIDETNRKLHEQFPGQPVTPAGVPRQTGSTAPNNPLNPNNIYGPGHALGGAISGAGGPKSDIIPIWASNGEHMLSAADVNAMGGQGGVYAFRNALHRADGGSIDSALLSNVPAGRYSQTSAADLTKGLGDCSSAIEDLVNLLDGQSTAGRSMSTANEAQWLQSRGFLPGKGGPGDFRVGFNSGHTQATLPDGTPFNWGSDAAAARRGIGGTGADDPAFTSHFYRPAKATGGQIAQDYADGLTEGGQDAAKDLKDSGGPSSGGMDGSSLGQSIFSGILQGIGLDGSVFSNPFDWPNVKSGIALANWGGGLLKSAMSSGEEGPTTSFAGGGGSIGGLNLPSISSFMKPIGSDGGDLNGFRNAPHQGTGAAPGPAPVIVNGNVGMDPRGFMQTVASGQNQAYRRNMTSVRPK